MIRNKLLFYDFETGSKNKYKTQPIQIAAVVIDLRALDIVEDSLFVSTIKPELDDEKATTLGLDPIQDDALKVNGFTREELEKAPDCKLVWSNFLDYTKRFNLKGNNGSKWDSVALSGFNNSNFDDYILARLCEKYGPKLDEYGGWTCFHPFVNIDLHMLIQGWFHSIQLNDSGSMSMDALRDFFGIDKTNAHRADIDVISGALLLIKFFKLQKLIVSGQFKGGKIKFQNCFDLENKKMKELLQIK